MFVEELFQMGYSFMVGLYTATSPCIFPLLPLFLMRSLQSEDSRRRSVLVTTILIAGIISSFAVYAIIAEFIALLLLQYYLTVQAIVGSLVIITGIFTASHRLREITGISRLSATRDPGDPKGLIGVFTVGFGYALLAAPCSGFAILGFFTSLIAITDVIVVVLMFLMLCIGVAIPYLAIALVTGEARFRLATRIENAAHKIEIVVGIFLILVGAWLLWPYLEFTLGL
jgi:cytochrome c biogenesis protein CcdA